LVPTQDSDALAEAIKRIALDSSLRERMGEANYRRGKEFCPDVVVPQILDIIFTEKKRPYHFRNLSKSIIYIKAICVSISKIEKG
jgi:hypothetical protein